MQQTSTAASRRFLVLNREKLNELRRSAGIKSEAELARRIGVDPATLYRLSTGKSKPSNEFLAGLKMAFPIVPLDDLLKVVVTAEEPARAATRV